MTIKPRRINSARNPWKRECETRNIHDRYKYNIKKHVGRKSLGIISIWGSDILAIHVEAWTDPEESRRWRLPEFLYNRHMKVARMWTLHTGRLQRLSRPGRIKSMRNPYDSIGRNEPATFRLVEQCLKQLQHHASAWRRSNSCAVTKHN